MSRPRMLLFAMLPALTLFGGAEVLLRVGLPDHLRFARALVGEETLHLAIFRDPATSETFQVPVTPNMGDDLLGWRNRPGFRQEPYLVNAAGLLSPRNLTDPKPQGVYRLLVLGDSSPAGMGLESHRDAWPQVLQQILGAEVEVANAATIGYSSEQSWRFLKTQGDRLQPDGLAIYLGNNDSHGTAVPDRDLLDSLTAPRNALERLDGWLVDRSAIYALLAAFKLWILDRAQGREMGARSTEHQRVPAEDFRENLLAMVTWARQRRVDVFLLTPPTPLDYPPLVLEQNLRRRWEPGFAGRDACLDAGEKPETVLPALLGTSASAARYPVLSLIGAYRDQALRCFEERLGEQEDLLRAAIDEKEAAVLLNNLGFLLARKGEPGPAMELFRRAQEIAPGRPSAYYNAGILSRRLGSEEVGRRELQRAADRDPTATRIHASHLDVLRELGRAEKDVHLIEASAAFLTREYEVLFSDHVHPNQAGQRWIAEMVAEAWRARPSEPRGAD